MIPRELSTESFYRSFRREIHKAVDFQILLILLLTTLEYPREVLTGGHAHSSALSWFSQFFRASLASRSHDSPPISKKEDWVGLESPLKLCISPEGQTLVAMQTRPSSLPRIPSVPHSVGWGTLYSHDALLHLSAVCGDGIRENFYFLFCFSVFFNVFSLDLCYFYK